MGEDTEALDGEVDIAVAAPGWAGVTGDAAEIWNHLYPALLRSNLIRPAELHVLARYCKHVARWIKLSAKVDTAGETYETESKHGKLQRINPDLNALLRIETAMLAIEDRFGLSSAARLRILSMKAATGGQGALPLGGDQPATAASEPAASSVGDNVRQFPGIGPVPVRAVK
jgi:P27 family predicted phage terminase small subunit